MTKVFKVAWFNMKYCNNCGSEAVPNMVMCAKCGKTSFSEHPVAVKAQQSAQVTQSLGMTSVQGQNLSTNGSFINTRARCSHVARFFAAVIDGIIVTILATLIPIVFVAMLKNLSSDAQDLIYSVTSFIVSLLYYSILHSSQKQATFGKQICGIKLTNEIGQITFWLAAGRAILPTIVIAGLVVLGAVISVPMFMLADDSDAMISGAIVVTSLLALLVVFGPQALILMREDGRSLYDLICRTQVVPAK